MKHTTAPRRRIGFTLVELMIVITIIGILVSLILIAAQGGVRAAEAKATQSLISKLEAGITDRIDALTTYRLEATPGHLALAQIIPSAGNAVPGIQRAQVIAQFDMMKAELPDVFAYTTQVTTTAPAAGTYPLNFAMSSSPLGGTPALPMGVTINTAFPLVTGWNGASFVAAAAIYKNAGYSAWGLDGIDNNGDGAIDDLLEGGTDPTAKPPAWNATLAQTIANNLANHKHITARSEMLYAILVEGQGPLGSVFNKDDFTTKEVQDTDGDGLPEFVDAWGQPLQFYRWPVFYNSDVQKGVTAGEFAAAPSGPYNGTFQYREQNPLDPNQQLMAPSWWSSTVNTGVATGNPFAASATPPSMSAAAVAFQNYFTLLIEPGASGNTSPPYLTYWDRGKSSFSARRAFYSRFLVLSAGPDKQYGVAILSNFTPADSTLNPATNPALLYLESQARQTNFGALGTPSQSPYFAPNNPGTPSTMFPQNATNYDPTDPTTGETLSSSGYDDITNHNLEAPGGGIQ